MTGCACGIRQEAVAHLSERFMGNVVTGGSCHLPVLLLQRSFLTTLIVHCLITVSNGVYTSIRRLSQCTSARQYGTDHYILTNIILIYEDMCLHYLFCWLRTLTIESFFNDHWNFLNYRKSFATLKNVIRQWLFRNIQAVLFLSYLCTSSSECLQNPENVTSSFTLWRTAFSIGRHTSHG